MRLGILESGGAFSISLAYFAIGNSRQSKVGSYLACNKKSVFYGFSSLRGWTHAIQSFEIMRSPTIGVFFVTGAIHRWWISSNVSHLQLVVGKDYLVFSVFRVVGQTKLQMSLLQLRVILLLRPRPRFFGLIGVFSSLEAMVWKDSRIFHNQETGRDVFRDLVTCFASTQSSLSNLSRNYCQTHIFTN